MNSTKTFFAPPSSIQRWGRTRRVKFPNKTHFISAHLVQHAFLTTAILTDVHEMFLLGWRTSGARRLANYFGLPRTVLKYLGISFTGNESFLYIFCSALWLSSIALTYTVVEFYEVYMYRNDLDTVVSILSYLGTDVLGVLKVSVLLYYRLRIGRTLDSLEKGVFAPSPRRGGDLEEQLIRRCLFITNCQTSLYYLSVVMVCSIGGVGTILKRLLNDDDHRRWEMPFMSFSWFDVTKSPNYEIVWFYQTVWRTLYALIVSSTDSLIAAVLAHISVQCRILQNALRRIIRNAVGESDDLVKESEIDASLIPWPILEKHMKEMVDYHLAIIRMAEDFEVLFNMLILTVFAATLFILCFIMYHASLVNLFSMRAAQDFSYVGVVTIQVFLYCYWGNEVTLESQKVADACWDTNFIGSDVRFQKGLALIIRRCQKPIILTAGKFTDLSLRTYVWILRASYSYYMVLRNHNQI